MPPPRGVALPALLCVALVLAARGGADEDEAARDLALARAHERAVQAAIALVRSTVVTIGVEEEASEGGDAPGPRVLRSGGSGVLVSPDGLVLTNDHVTEGRDEVRVGLADGRTLPGRVVARDAVGDLALLRVPAEGLPCAALGDSDALAPGDPVLALGNPFGLARDDHDPAATLGIVSALHRFQGGTKVYGDAIQVDAAVNPGNSGGPLFDLDGRLVGLTGRISLRGPARHNVGVGFAIPSAQIAAVLGDLREGRDVTRGYLGVRFASQPDGEGGAVVREVVAGSPAARAGLRAGDRILRVGARDVTHPVRLQNYLTVLTAGATVRLTVLRDGHPLELEARLDAAPSSRSGP